MVLNSLMALLESKGNPMQSPYTRLGLIVLNSLMAPCSQKVTQCNAPTRGLVLPYWIAWWPPCSHRQRTWSVHPSGRSCSGLPPSSHGCLYSRSSSTVQDMSALRLIDRHAHTHEQLIQNMFYLIKNLYPKSLNPGNPWVQRKFRA